MCDVFYWLPCQTGIQTPACCSVDMHHVSWPCMDRLHVLVVQHYNYVKRSKTEAYTTSNFYNFQPLFHKQAKDDQLNLSICCNLTSHSWVAPTTVVKVSKIKHTICNKAVSEPLPRGVPGRLTLLTSRKWHTWCMRGNDMVLLHAVQDRYEKETNGTSMDVDSALYVYLHTVCGQLFGNVTGRYDPIQLTSGNKGILPLPAALSVLSTSYWLADPRRIENQRDKRPWTTGSPPDCGAQLGSEGCLPPLLHLSHSVRALFSVFFNWPLLL